MEVGKNILEVWSDGTMIVHVHKDITDDEIDEVVRQTIPIVIQAARGCVCAFNGYDYDDRELYNIPEVVGLAQRLISHGFLAILHVTTLMTRDEYPHYRPYFGAMEVWSLAEHFFTPEGSLEITKDMFKRIVEEILPQSNRIAHNLLPKTRDGQHRTKSL